MMRLSQAAKKLNVGTITIIEILSSKGHRIDNNPNAKLSFDLLEVLSKELHSPELLGDMGGVSTSGSSAETSSPTQPNDEILYFREEPVEPEIIKIEHNLQGPKVLGKIDLNSKGPAKIIPIDANPEVKKEAPKFEPIPELVVETSVDKTEPVIITPVAAEEKPAPIEEVKHIEISKPVEEVKEVDLAKEESKSESIAELPKVELKL